MIDARNKLKLFQVPTRGKTPAEAPVDSILKASLTAREVEVEVPERNDWHFRTIDGRP